MSFSDFKSVEQVMEHYPLLVTQEKFLPNTQLELPEWLSTNINFSLAKRGVLESELFFRENFIHPFLLYVWQRHEDLKLWTNYKIEADSELQGEPDYLVASLPVTATRRLLSLPLLAVVEAKRQDFEWGWGQCLAGLIACQKLNQSEQQSLYGIVSTGLFWEFGKLEGDHFTRDPNSYSIRQPEEILGILDYLFGECEKQTHTKQPSEVQ